jgi:hypothetical protein
MRQLRILFSLTLALLLTVGCGGGGGGGSTGTLSLRLADGPFPDTSCLTAANVVVNGVEVQSEGGWVDIPLAGGAPQTFNLLDLRSGLDAQLAVGELATGTYHQIRLHLDSATLVFTDASEKSFTVPSGMQSGIKINVNPQFLIAAGQTTPILLDFSLAESFHVTGTGGDPTCEDLKSEETIFNPVIHAVNLDTSGVLAGIVYYADGTTAAPDVVVTVRLANADPSELPVTTTVSANGSTVNAPLGSYAVHLDPGFYDLYAPGDTDLLVEDVQVTSQQITTQDLTTSTAAP